MIGFPESSLNNRNISVKMLLRGRSLETPSLGNGCGRCSSVSREQGEKVNLWKDVAVTLRARPLIKSNSSDFLHLPLIVSLLPLGGESSGSHGASGNVWSLLG